MSTLRQLKAPLNDYAISEDGRVWSFRSDRWLSEYMVNGHRAVTMTVNRKRYTRLISVLLRG